MLRRFLFFRLVGFGFVICWLDFLLSPISVQRGV
jgi:hypothetical protein